MSGLEDSFNNSEDDGYPEDGEEYSLEDELVDSWRDLASISRNDNLLKYLIITPSTNEKDKENFTFYYESFVKDYPEYSTINDPDDLAEQYIDLLNAKINFEIRKQTQRKVRIYVSKIKKRNSKDPILGLISPRGDILDCSKFMQYMELGNEELIRLPYYDFEDLPETLMNYFCEWANQRFSSGSKKSR